MAKKPQTELTQKELEQIAAGKADLQFAEAMTGLDWRILAGIWYRENSLRKSKPGRVGGVWQFDPPLSPKRIKTLLDKYSVLSESQKQEVIKDGGNSFKLGAIAAACFIRDKVPAVLDVRKRGDIPDNEVGDSFYAYNGKAYGPDWRKSPYVNNNADAAHIGLKITGTLPSKTNPHKRERVSYPDTRLGAFVVYRQLKELYPRSSSVSISNKVAEEPIKKEPIKDLPKNNPKNEKQKTVSFLDGQLNEPEENN